MPRLLNAMLDPRRFFKAMNESTAEVLPLAHNY